jgi:hypothetical protein
MSPHSAHPRTTTTDKKCEPRWRGLLARSFDWRPTSSVRHHKCQSRPSRHPRPLVAPSRTKPARRPGQPAPCSYCPNRDCDCDHPINQPRWRRGHQRRPLHITPATATTPVSGGTAFSSLPLALRLSILFPSRTLFYSIILDSRYLFLTVTLFKA